MTDNSLSRLYRLSTGSRVGAAAQFDADTLVAAAAGTLAAGNRAQVMAAVADSPAHADVVRLLRELAPASAELSQACGERTVVAHARMGRQRQHAAPASRFRNGMRWSGLAACLSLAFGVWAWQAHQQQADSAQFAAMEAAMKPDRIFTSQDQIFTARIDAGHSQPVRTHADGLFQADFNGS